MRSRLSPRIVAFGDSTTAPREGVRTYTQLVEAGLRDDGVSAEVINAGVPGDTTEDARARFDADVVTLAPDCVVIQFGINDAALDVWRDPPAGTPRVGLDRYTENLDHFARRLTAVGSRCVLMTPNRLTWTPETLDLYGRAPYDPADPDGFSRPLEPYAQRTRDLAARHGLPLIDVAAAYARETTAGGDIGRYLLDGIHPNDAGHRLVASRLLDALRTTTGVGVGGG